MKLTHEPTQDTHYAELRRERDEARAEVERLRDALRIAESTRNAAQAIATRETERRREAEAERDDAASASVRHHYEVMACARSEESALADADALRELAWSWCIEAKTQHERAAILHGLLYDNAARGELEGDDR